MWLLLAVVYSCVLPSNRPCRAVVFVVDSATFQREVKDVAEFLYQVLIDSMALKNTPAFLVACNKQGAYGVQLILGGLLLGTSSSPAVVIAEHGGGAVVRH